MYSEKDIFKQLKELGVPQDRPVTLHISLKSVGDIDGRGEGLLDILIKYVTANGGLLCVPTHTHNRLRQNDIITLDFLEPSTNIGTFSTIAIHDKRGIRSINPSHSMTVFGEKEAAKRFADCDKLIKSCTSPLGCYGQLYRDDGYVLLIGVGQNRNTYIHCIEEMLNLPERLTDDFIDTTIRHLDGSIEHFPIRLYGPTKRIGDISASFPMYEKPFRACGCIVDGKIGDATTQLCSAKGMADVAKLIYERSDGIDFLGERIEIDEKYYK